MVVRKFMLLGCLLLPSIFLFSHPMPYSYIDLTINEDKLTVELQIPLQDFELAHGNAKLKHDVGYPLQHQQEVKAYVKDHVKIKSIQGKSIPYTIMTVMIDSTNSELSGTYYELQVTLQTKNNSELNPRKFSLEYDAVIHQISSHYAVVKLKQDFNNAITPEKAQVLGIIKLDVPSNSVKPFMVVVDKGSKWKGVKSMIALGMHHIRVGADHILFLLTRLLIAPLRSSKGKWSLFQGWPYTIHRFLTLSFAFTVGHSLALFGGALEAVPFNIEIIEVLIAASILVTALNCIYPFLTMKETWVAMAFGAVHGLAFSESITSLDLSTTNKMLSILGFNIGIETMQVVNMIIFSPVLFFSRWKMYHVFRVLVALGTIVAAGIWLVERATGTPIIIP